MATQFDFNAGLDPSALSSITQAQLLQMIQQIAPISNIGGVIFQAGPSLATPLSEGAGGAPDVTNNPRFARYIWLNTFGGPSVPPTPYYYDDTNNEWESTSVAAGSINNASISATAEIAVSKLADGAANEIISTNADGVTVNWTSVSSLLAALNDSVPLTAIDDTAAVGATSFLRRDGSTVIWKTFAETVTAIQAALSGVSPSIFTPGANNTLLGTNGAGAVAFNTPANILANGSITLPLLNVGGAATNDTLKHDGSNWVKTTPTLDVINATTISTVGISIAVMGAAAVFTQAHGLSALPKLIRAVCVCNVGDVGYAIGDELEINALRIAANNFSSPSISADATNITITLATAAGNEIPNKGTGVYAAMTEASWTLKVYAWR